MSSATPRGSAPRYRAPAPTSTSWHWPGGTKHPGPASARLVPAVHGEIVAECPAADADRPSPGYAEGLTRAGQEVLPTVPMIVETAAGPIWEKP